MDEKYLILYLDPQGEQVYQANHVATTISQAMEEILQTLGTMTGCEDKFRIVNSHNVRKFTYYYLLKISTYDEDNKDYAEEFYKMFGDLIHIKESEIDIESILGRCLHCIEVKVSPGLYLNHLKDMATKINRTSKAYASCNIRLLNSWTGSEEMVLNGSRKHDRKKSGEEGGTLHLFAGSDFTQGGSISENVLIVDNFDDEISEPFYEEMEVEVRFNVKSFFDVILNSRKTPFEFDKSTREKLIEVVNDHLSSIRIVANVNKNQYGRYEVIQFIDERK